MCQLTGTSYPPETWSKTPPRLSIKVTSSVIRVTVSLPFQVFDIPRSYKPFGFSQGFRIVNKTTHFLLFLKFQSPHGILRS